MLFICEILEQLELLTWFAQRIDDVSQIICEILVQLGNGEQLMLYYST